MLEFTQGICDDGSAILMDGQPLSIEEILEKLRNGAKHEAALNRIQVECTARKAVLIARHALEEV